MGSAKEIKMAKRSSCPHFVLAILITMAVFMYSHTANAIQCKSGEIFASASTVVCPPCIISCARACPQGSTVASSDCVYRLLSLPSCECCCKMPKPKPSPPPPSPPPPSPPPPPPSPPPPSPPPPPPSPPPPSPPPPPPSPPPPTPSPPPPSPPPPSCREECPYEMEIPGSSADEQPCRYVLADDNQIMMD